MIIEILFTSVLSAHAAAPSGVACNTHDLRQKEVHAMPGAGYWMQSMDECRITYTGWGGYHSHVYNYCTQAGERITDEIDAFPVPGTDGKLYIHPRDGISFYNTADGLRDPDNYHPIFADKEMDGDYESVGLLQKSANGNVKVRVAVGYASGQFRDYDVVKQQNGSYKVSTAGDVTDVCTNIPSHGLDNETPILSRNGQMIAGRASERGKMVIWAIDDDANCKALFTIPTFTGKVSFSFDNRHVAYIISDPHTHNGRLMEADIQTKKVRTISSPDEDVNYMTYKPDGTLIYSRGKEDSHTHHLETADLVLLNAQGIPQTSTADSKVTEGLGMLWAAACGKHYDLDAENAIGSRLTGDACKALANGDLSALDRNHNTLTKDTLATACGAAGSTPPAGSRVTE